MAEVPPIEGYCDARFEPVREALVDNFRERGELGAAVAVSVEGRTVVDVWGGWMDEQCARPWRRDTLVDVFSVGKAMATLCALTLVERGRLALDVPVSRYWPEFAAAGKDEITLRMVLAHRAGLPAIRRDLPESAMYDWELMTSALAAEEPWWEPDSIHGYHVNTFGFLVGELVRRGSDAQSMAAFFRREVATPLAADFHFGLGSDHDPRVAEFVFGRETEQQAESEQQAIAADEARQFLLGRVYLNPPGLSGIGTVNTRAWRAAEIPSANAHASADAIARIYRALADGAAGSGVRLLDPETIELAIAEQSAGEDFVLGRPSRFGLGFQLTQRERPLGPNPRSFGHFGVGGSLGFADLDARIAFGYVMNRAGPRWQNPRNRALVDAVYASL